VARLGLDPYTVDDDTAADVQHIAESLHDELVGDFFDNADPSALRRAAEWTRRAVDNATRAAARARNTLGPLYEAAAMDTPFESVGPERPWVTGYRMAGSVRRALELSSVAPFDISPWVGARTSSQDSGGIPAVAAVADGRCGVFQANDPARLGRKPTRFAQARALGRVLTRPDQRSFVLSAARGHDERVAGAFAAELLAPADGVRQSLEILGNRLDDAALDAIAARFAVSPLVIRHQYDNQLAGGSGYSAAPA
jgi:hypothetical protein